MKNKVFIKDIFTSPAHSIGRFIGIAFLMCISALTFIGLKMTQPDMIATSQAFYRQTNLADLTISSNYGLDKDDVKTINSVTKNGQVEFGYMEDSSIKNSTKSLRIMSLPNKISKYQVIKGSLPKNNEQIAISSNLSEQYKIGQTIKLNQTSLLKEKSLKIVGFVKGAEYSDKSNIATTNVGTGQLSGIGVVKESAFKSGSYSLARVRLDSTKKISSYSNAYDNQIKDYQTNIQKILEKKANRRQKVIKMQLIRQESEIEQAQNQLEQAKNYGQDVSKEQLKLEKNRKEFDAYKSKVSSLGKVKYYLLTRNNENGYQTYKDNTEKIDVVTNIFPIFLFAVAALVSFATMTRFINDERQNIGTLRAIGYGKVAVSLKFIFYSLSSGLLGGVIGAIGGYLLLPKIIFKAYTTNLEMGAFKEQFSWYYLILTIIIALFCTVGAAVIQLIIVLKEKSTELLLPKVPKAGSRILLEKITPLWTKLSFNYKVTFRNIFRYKVKTWMTILGVAGCTGLLVMGFGIRDSITGLDQLQYGEIVKYDMIALQNPQLTSDQEKKLSGQLNSKAIKRHMPIKFEELTKKADKIEENISLIVPDTTKDLNKYISLRNRQSKEKLILNNKGAVISEKLANLLNLKVGQKLTLKANDGKKVSIPIQGITEMYMGHYLIMTKNLYQKLFNKNFESNAQIITLKNKHDKNINNQAQKLMKTGALQGINLNANNRQIIANLVKSMNSVMFLLIALATLLAVVVVFTLTTTNFEERIREISTVKVLGFYSNETTMYIYRETIILSLIGVLLGFFIGNWLHAFILNNLAPTNVMFKPNIFWTNYLISAAIPLIVTGVLAIFVYRRINQVDMLDALKAVD